jgi:hypothetical protein
MNARRKRADWSRPLPRPLVIPEVMTLKTLADVRELIEHHLPPAFRAKATWQYVMARLTESAWGADAADAAIALRMVLTMEGVECRPQ